MNRVFDLAAAGAAAAGPCALRHLAGFARAALAYVRNLRKELSMTDLPDAPIAPASPAPDAPIAVAPITAPAVDPSRVVQSVAQTVAAHPDVPSHKAASVIASVLSGLYQAEPAIFAVSRASARTQTEVSLGLGLAEIIVGAFLHPAGA